jgi:hypothetical protein
VHFTRRIDGEVWAGPNAVLAFARERYGRFDLSPRDLVATLAFPGFRRLARRYWRTGLAEMRRDWSKTAFVQACRRLVPELEPDDVEWGPSGIRAQTVLASGDLADDFSVQASERILHVRNAPSPAATASLAIGRVLAERAIERFDLRYPTAATRGRRSAASSIASDPGPARRRSSSGRNRPRQHASSSPDTARVEPAVRRRASPAAAAIAGCATTRGSPTSITRRCRRRASPRRDPKYRTATRHAVAGEVLLEDVHVDPALAAGVGHDPPPSVSSGTYVNTRSARANQSRSGGLHDHGGCRHRTSCLAERPAVMSAVHGTPAATETTARSPSAKCADSADRRREPGEASSCSGEMERRPTARGADGEDTAAGAGSSSRPPPEAGEAAVRWRWR